MRKKLWILAIINFSTIPLVVGCGGGGDEDQAPVVERFVEWISSTDGFLVWDRNGDGILQGEDFFGNPEVTGRTEETPHLDLGLLDQNGDGVIDSSDSAFAFLQVWRDLDQDGAVDPGELLSLSEAYISELRIANVNLEDDVYAHIGTFASIFGAAWSSILNKLQDAKQAGEGGNAALMKTLLDSTSGDFDAIILFIQDAGDPALTNLLLAFQDRQANVAAISAQLPGGDLVDLLEQLAPVIAQIQADHAVENNRLSAGARFLSDTGERRWEYLMYDLDGNGFQTEFLIGDEAIPVFQAD